MNLGILKYSVAPSQLRVATFQASAPMYVIFDIMRHPEVVVSIPSYRNRLVSSSAPVSGCTTPFCANRVNKMWASASDTFYKNLDAINDMNDPPSEAFITALAGNLVDIPFIMTSGSWVTVTERMLESNIPEVRSLASDIRKLLINSPAMQLEADGWHLPYASSADIDPLFASLKTLSTKLNLSISLETLESTLISSLIRLSVARCAVAGWYIGATPEEQVENDLNNFSLLTEGKIITYKDHFMHQLQPDTIKTVDGESVWRNAHLHNKIVGWVSYSNVISWEKWASAQTSSPPPQSELVEVNGCSQG